jgi:hypothetical protein
MPEGKITYLIQAEFNNGTPLLFGVEVDAANWERGLVRLNDIMDKDGGHRFIDAKHLQILIRLQYITCPSCQKLAPAADPRCPECGMNFQTEEMMALLKTGKTRIIPKIKFQLKALVEGAEDTYRIRPEHLASYSIIPSDSPICQQWEQATEEAQRQITALRSGLTVVKAPASGPKILLP